jgi:hypothetical protein
MTFWLALPSARSPIMMKRVGLPALTRVWVVCSRTTLPSNFTT